jgi:phosphatidylinositol alpha-mannosyltransferase
MRRWYANFLARHEIPDVIMAGYVSATDLPRFYASCEIFCAPNTGDESFGIVLLEAMAAGKPIVATDIDGFRTVVTDGREGLLVERKSTRLLANALSTLLADPELGREMGLSGRRTAQRYDWPHVVDAVEAIYGQAPTPPQPVPQLRFEPTLSPH